MEDDPSGASERPAQPGAPEPGGQPQWQSPGGPPLNANPAQDPYGPYGPPGTPPPPAGPAWASAPMPPGASAPQPHYGQQYAPGPGQQFPPGQQYPPGPGQHYPPGPQFPPGPGQQFPPGYPVPPGYPASRSKGSRAWIITLSAFGILAVFVIVGVVAVLGRDSGSGGTGLGQDSPGASQGTGQGQATRQPDGSIALARSGVDHPVLEIYEDFQCPACKSFEDTNGATVKELIADGKAKVVYRPFRLFQQEPLSSNSRRAAAAALCAPAGNWIAFHDLLFHNQPPEGQDGFSTADLVTWGKQAGIDDPAFATCVTTQQKAGLVEQATHAALAAGVQSTPTVKLDGTPLSQGQIFTADGLRRAVVDTQPSPAATA
ncbi:MAG: oxidoreductase [Actinomycetia bacterium]|nr:oxidoreductase [Actinomycetes bacterium]